MFPQLGAPIGFICSGGIFLLLGATLNEEQFFRFGWRIPFLASALLVILGLWVRLTLEETPVFKKALDKGERVKVPMATVFRAHAGMLVLGTLLAILVFVLFYLMTVFTLGWGTTQLGYTRSEFLLLQIFGMLFFAGAIPLSAVLADKYGRRVTQIGAGIAIFLFGLVFSRLFHAGDAVSTALFLAIGLALMGFCYGPLGTTLSELFPTAVRYTGSSLTFNLAGIFGASLAPYIAFWLAPKFGLAAVGWYLSAAAVISLAALWLTRETKDQGL
jgi:MFS family permease